ncbi:hypothetical protein GYMLUDRAFT_44120 [Collybiopsis luxurians FD-317 M1]|uniref:Histone H1 n=1 Tax=Collybiopsis luxurians FD-317 M1 TaxID=944289 RepID=A0A0D0CM65_9AGAR|nr:hypothetical protein GYMLUDRAFT_44120 [Collybiopsis luxurians FD-317 M1]
MQVASSPQNHTAQVDHERKRLYLSLLPPLQVIELCLTFDLHAPAFVRATIWPADLDAAIATLTKLSEEKPQIESTSSADPNPKPKDPPKHPTTTAEAPGPPVSSSTTPSAPPSASGLYQPPRFAYASQPAYPHTPYYPQPSWASYSQTPYGGSHPYAPPQPPAHHPPYHHETGSADDLPSYEDMIVEALNDDVRDPEGLAPKDLYTWMASHYPVQANFRPSASQALQKAFKRGRFEKSLSGKYRLNPNWKGGNTTRRTTRRPQTHGGSVPPRLSYSGKTSSYSNPSYMFSSASTPSITSHGSNPHPPEDDIGDAYEAAQHILKALNFGDGDGLYKISQDPEDDRNSGIAKSNSETTDNPPPSSTIPDASTTGNISVENIRAELQVQLVLLAAQLSEIANSTESDSVAMHDATAPAVSSDAPAVDRPGILKTAVSTTMNSLNTATAVLATAPSPPVPLPASNANVEQVDPKEGSTVVPSPLETPKEESLPLSSKVEVPQEATSSGTSVNKVSEPPPPTSLLEVIPLADVEDSDEEEMDEVVV